MRRRIISLLTGIILFGGLAAGCTERPHPGIEAGNPNLSGKAIRIVPEAGDEIYEVTLLDETTAEVSRIQTGNIEAVLETINVPYTQSGGILNLEAVFSNSRRIEVNASLTENGGITSGNLSVDGSVVNACFEVPGLSPACGTNESPDAAAPLETGPGELPNGDGENAFLRTIDQVSPETVEEVSPSEFLELAPPPPPAPYVDRVTATPEFLYPPVAPPVECPSGRLL